MMDRKILACMLAIGLVSVMATAATVTWLSDREEASWTITVKTAELSAPTSIKFKDKLAPGESTTETITIKNTGEVTLKVTLSAVPDDPEWVTFTFDTNDFNLVPKGTQDVVIKATLSDAYTESGKEITGTIIVEGVQVHL